MKELTTSRRSSLEWAGFLWLALPFLLLIEFAVAQPTEAGRQKPRNIVMIVGDDHGRELGCYGNSVVQTPNLDALAAQGTRFENAFCTTASCSPSRSVILSGLHNHANGQYGLAHATHKQNTHPWVRSLPALLRAAGFRTASVGKVHVLPEAVYPFDSFLNEGTAGGRNGVRMAENSESWIRQDNTRPFFLYFCPTDPHRAAQGFANGTAYPGVSPVKYKPGEIKVPPFLPDLPETRQDLAEYYVSISRLDQGIGRLMKALDATGHRDDTIVFYLSDNGPPFPGAKTGVYDPGIRLPLIVRSPDQKQRGVVSTAMVSWTDLTPTVLNFAGAKGPDYPLHGRSFLSVLDVTNPPGWDQIFASHQFHEITMYYPMRAIRTPRYKYIWNIASPLPFPFASDLYDSPTWQATLRDKPARYGARTVQALIQRPKHELYDLQSDPNEAVNLADRPEHASTLKDLQARMRTWQEATKDPWLVKYEHE